MPELHLHSIFEGSVYLPPAAILEIGERMMKLLNSDAVNAASYLFIDEWDANLDEANKAALHDRLDRLSETRVIFEVRNRSTVS